MEKHLSRNIFLSIANMYVNNLRYLCDSNSRCNYYNLIAFNVLDDIAYSIIPLLWFVIAVSIRQMDLISRFRNIKVTNLNCIEH